MEEDRIEVVRPGRIGWLPDAASLVQHGLLKALVHRPLGEVVPEMPFAEDPGPVAGGLQHFRDRGFVGVHHGPAEVSVHDSGAIVVPARHERGARRSADRRHVESRHFDAFRRHGVQARCLQHRIPAHPELRPALIVGHHHDDIRGWRGTLEKGASRAQEYKRECAEYPFCHVATG